MLSSEGLLNYKSSEIMGLAAEASQLLRATYIPTYIPTALDLLSNKQTIKFPISFRTELTNKKMDTTLLPTTTNTNAGKKDLPRSHFFTKKVLVMSATLVLALAAIVGACAVALVMLPAEVDIATSQGRPLEISLQDKEKLHSMVSLAAKLS